MPPFLNRLWRSVRATVAPVPDISAELWLQTLQRYPFLARLSLPEQGKLRDVAFIKDPDGYWIEIVEAARLQGLGRPPAG